MAPHLTEGHVACSEAADSLPFVVHPWLGGNEGAGAEPLHRLVQASSPLGVASSVDITEGPRDAPSAEIMQA